MFAAVLGFNAAGASAATTLFTGRFVCNDRGVQLPLAGARVEFWGKPQDAHGFLGLGDATYFSSLSGTDQTGPNGEWSFEVHRRQDNQTRYEYSVTVRLDDGAGTTVSDWPDAGPFSMSTGTNQNDVAVQDYHTLVVPGGECPLWLALKHASDDYTAVTGQPTPFGGVHAEYNGPNVGWPYTAYDTIIWPDGSPLGPGPGSEVAAKHEFAHLIRNSSLGSQSNFLREVGQFDYRRRGNVCKRTSQQYAFHEGWAEFWAGDFLPAPCPATQVDPAVEGDVAWTLTRLEPTCGRRRMVAALLAHGQSIHSLGDFQRFVGSCVAVPLNPGSVPRSPISSPVRAGRWVTNIRSAFHAASGAASHLTSQLAGVRRAARHAPCLHSPCFQALERRLHPAILTGRVASARLLAKTLGSQISRRGQRLVSSKPTRTFLNFVRGTTRTLARRLARIGVQSVNRALAAGASIIRRDHTAATLTIVHALRSERTAFARARRRGVGLPFSLALFGGRAPKLKRVSTIYQITFDSFPDGTLVTTQTAPFGATFGAPAALGFPGAAPSHTCPAGPTIFSGVAVAPDCPTAAAGFRDTGAMARLTTPAHSVTVSVGASLAVPGGYAADLDGYDAAGNQIAADGVLVGSTTNGEGAGPTQSLRIQTGGSAPPIAYVSLSIDASPNNGERLVFDNFTYSTP